MAFDAFLKLDGIPGESTDDKHKGEIEVLSFSWGATLPATDSTTGNSATGLARGAGKVQFSDLSIVKPVDKATPQLLRASFAGTVIPTGHLTVRKAGAVQQEFLKVTLKDIMITSLANGGSTQNDAVPLEQLSLMFNKLEVAVTGGDGVILAGGNIEPLP